ncbi:MAG: hypothetical protein ACRDL5_13855 [Solirubrobacteraceae bacterium]
MVEVSRAGIIAAVAGIGTAGLGSLRTRAFEARQRLQIAPNRARASEFVATPRPSHEFAPNVC